MDAESDEDGLVNYGMNEEDPGGMTPGSLVVWSSAELGDGLEASVLQTNRVGLEDRNTGADDLSDEVGTVACDPDVTGLVDCESLFISVSL